MTDEEIDDLLFQSGNKAGRAEEHKPPSTPAPDANDEGPPAWYGIVVGVVLLLGGVTVFVWIAVGFAEMDDIARTYFPVFSPIIFAVLVLATVAVISGYRLIRQGVRRYRNAAS